MEKIVLVPKVDRNVALITIFTRATHTLTPLLLIHEHSHAYFILDNNADQAQPVDRKGFKYRVITNCNITIINYLNLQLDIPLSLES